MSGHSLFTAVVAALTASILLTAVLLYLSRLPRSEPALRLWTLAYGAYALRQVVNLAVAVGRPDLLPVADALIVMFAVLLLAGSLRFLRRDIPVRTLTLGTLSILSWIALGQQLELSFFWQSGPVHLAAGGAMLVTALGFWRHERREPGVGHRLLATTFLLWGLHLADYPLLRPIAWFAGIGFLITSGFALATALGLILVAQRRQQVLAEAAMARLRRSEAELRDSEARFRDMADTMPALLYITDAEGGCRFVNKRWLDYTGRSLECELGHGWVELVHPDDREAVAVQEARSFEQRLPYSFSYRLTGAGDRVRWFLDTGTPRFGADGSFLGFIGALVDMTEQRELALQLQQAQKMEAVGLLTGGVAHDFNNLLAIILGNLDLLDERLPADSGLRGLLGESVRAAERGAELTGRLLAFSRRQPLKAELTDVNRLVGRMTSLMRRTLGDNIRIETALEDGLAPVLIDAGQLESALLNLAINARDAMPQGGSLILRTGAVGPGETGRGAGSRDCLEILVEDTGHGMAPEILDRVFEPFFTTKRIGQGTGLGLSMVYGFVEQSGGRVTIESEPGRGTRVRLVLPCADVEGAAAEPPGVVRPEHSAGLGELILVVEDEPAVRQLAGDILDGLGYRRLEAADGPAALALLAERPDIALMLSDVMLPQGMNGLELARRARQLRPDLKVLFMSGFADQAIAEAGADAGELDLIAKPFRKLDLAQRLRQALDRQAPTLVPALRAV